MKESVIDIIKRNKKQWAKEWPNPTIDIGKTSKRRRKRKVVENG